VERAVAERDAAPWHAVWLPLCFELPPRASRSLSTPSNRPAASCHLSLSWTQTGANNTSANSNSTSRSTSSSSSSSSRSISKSRVPHAALCHRHLLQSCEQPAAAERKRGAGGRRHSYAAVRGAVPGQGLAGGGALRVLRLSGGACVRACVRACARECILPGLMRANRMCLLKCMLLRG